MAGLGTGIDLLAGSPDLASVLEAGRLAPSAYNIQPWRFLWLRTPSLLERIGMPTAEGHVVLVLEESGRRIPRADPLGSETYLGLGACLANLLIAGRALGWHAGVMPADVRDRVWEGVEGRVPHLGLRPAALVHWSTASPDHAEDQGATPGTATQLFVEGEPGGRVDGGSAAAPKSRALVQAITRRRSERGPHDGRRVPEVVIGECVSAADEVGRPISREPLALFVTSAPKAASATADLLRRSVRRALADPAICAEVAAWFRPSRESARRHGDGEALDAAGYGRWELLVARRALHASWRPLLMKLGGAERAARHAAAHAARSSLLMVWASLPHAPSPWEDDATAERYFVRAGCAIEASWLTLTAAGGGMQVMTPCVIFPESRSELAEILQLPPGYEPLSLQRAGYPLERSLETPVRRPLSKLVDCL